MRFLIPLLAAVVPTFATAAPAAFPVLARVSGVASGDVLNIRAFPKADASILGELAPDATGVELMAERDGWYLVNTGERSGWASGRYLTPGPNPFANGAVPATLRCLGTEPFWSLTRDDKALVLSTPEDQAGARFALRQTLVPRGDAPDRTFLAEGLTAIITPAQCSDGMSDRVYSLSATLILGVAPDAAQQSGCCTIAPL
ncbi:peptide-binding protein [Paracoccus suum]|uniref:Peptide-binding protein n=1 Tax=Paracoccus suum TaxID=2259340 RepID=A0A344PIQ5_9RHOB|nr:SH3 domain-containing protein [Paracoccus suum]AXC49260.1 peptide-binding protein [Paracoccus suum]